MSIYDYSGLLMGHTLRSLLGDDVVDKARKGKGQLGQMVEELFFKYPVNSIQEADFVDAHLELKCTPLLKKHDSDYRIKERLVCTMIDYFDIAKTSFEDSHLLSKCQLMLLLFYLHAQGLRAFDYKFLFRVLWQLPPKDLELIKNDYQTIADKVRRGEAHLLSEGDTLYLGACRKGQKDEAPQPQPYSDIKAFRRAFSLKPAYMRYILSHVASTPDGAFTNYTAPAAPSFELVSAKELEGKSFENIILDRFAPYIGKTYTEICSMLGIEAYQAKSKYADIVALIASNLQSKRLDKADEFIKSGIILKTIRVRPDGMPKEAMSFKNIDYFEVLENDDWIRSEAYELFTSRFLFAVFEPVADQTIDVFNHSTNQTVTEQAYKLRSVFFWTMPPHDLELAGEYWQDIRAAVAANKITAEAFWKISDHRKFHVRPKAKRNADKTANPHGGDCPKLCYWFNADYVKEIIDSEVE